MHRLTVWLDSAVPPVLHLCDRIAVAIPAAGLAANWLRRRHEANQTRRHFRHVTALAAGEAGAPEFGMAAAGPRICFVTPVFNTRPDYLDDLLNSFLAQDDDDWQLILSDDGSSDPDTLGWLDRQVPSRNLQIVRNRVNCGIAAATNTGIEHALGQWVALIDHDDAIAPFAIKMIKRALAARPHCLFMYTDEVIADRHLQPTDYFLKPAWDPVLLSGVNYINHLSIYQAARLKQLGGLRTGFDGSQDYDLVLRFTKGLTADQIVHLPYPAYLWRRDGQSYSARFLEAATANARKALGQHYGSTAQPRMIDRAVSPDLHRVRFDVPDRAWPPLSVVIPSRDSYPLISRLLDCLLGAGTDYPDLEVIVIDNGSTDPRVRDLYETLRRRSPGFTVDIREEPFNFSRSVNRGMAIAAGRHVCLLNNDIEIPEPGWLKELVSCLDYPDVGIVGAKLLYPNRQLQHAGVIVGLGGLAGHWYIDRDEDFPGPMGRLWTRQSLSAVTGACMLIARDCLDKVGPFDEDVFPIAYNDVDFCLRARGHGFRIVWTPFCKLVHHESASRGSDETPANIARFNRDKDSLKQRHRTQDYQDAAFNPWYSKDHSEPHALFLEQLPFPR